jgi:hypothetical protein
MIVRDYNPENPSSGPPALIKSQTKGTRDGAEMAMPQLVKAGCAMQGNAANEQKSQRSGAED